jgi:hypothetical protein
MRALIIARDKHFLPPELLAPVAQGFVEWRELHRARLEHFSFFTTGTGGCAVANVANESELFQMMATWPLTPFSEVETHLLVDGDEALAIWAGLVQELASG